MAQIFRREPAAPATQERPKARPAVTGGGGGGGGVVGRLGRAYSDIMSELRKVTWPTREETRNLTIVVIGISASLGISLWAIDQALAFLYRLINP